MPVPVDAEHGGIAPQLCAAVLAPKVAHCVTARACPFDGTKRPARDHAAVLCALVTTDDLAVELLRRVIKEAQLTVCEPPSGQMLKEFGDPWGWCAIVISMLGQRIVRCESHHLGDAEAI